MEQDKDIAEQVEKAYFVMLSLCRELYIRINNHHEKSADYAAWAVKIKKEMKFLDKEQLINKAEKVYAPLLKEMLGENK